MYYPVSALLIEFLILSVVESQDSYGYEISQTVKIVADIKESTLYPILKKLEKNGYLTTYSQEFQGSMEFVTANLLLSAFSPVAAFFLALVVNARHLFYGLSNRYFYIYFLKIIYSFL